MALQRAASMSAFETLRSHVTTEEQMQALVKATIKDSLKVSLLLAARHKIGPEQLRILLDELLLNYVDYECIEEDETGTTNTGSAPKWG